MATAFEMFVLIKQLYRAYSSPDVYLHNSTVHTPSFSSWPYVLLLVRVNHVSCCYRLPLQVRARRRPVPQHVVRKLEGGHARLLCRSTELASTLYVLDRKSVV